MVTDESETADKTNVCPICERGFDSLGGIRQHWSRGHTDEEIQEAISRKMQSMSQQLLIPPETSTYSNSLNNTLIWNNFQIIYDDNNCSSGKTHHQFRIIENNGAGDCLFLALLQFLRNSSNKFTNIPTNVNEFRVSVVEYILANDNDGFQHNFERFKESIYINLRNHISRLSRYDRFEFSDETIARTYSKYMSKPGNYGTTPELCAIAEMFDLRFCVIQEEVSENYSCYDYGSTGDFKPIAYLLFTGNANSGHFRLLDPIDKTYQLHISPGKYKLVEANTSSRMLSIEPLTTTSTKPTTEASYQQGVNIEKILNDRILCGTCGFTAKNNRGLKIHSRIHKDDSSSDSAQTQHQQSVADFTDDSDLVEKFGVLLNNCRQSIPVIRIIQKSVRTVVCEELTRVIDHVVIKNNIFAWLRLLSFPFLVLNMISKGKHSQNFIRHNLSAFSKINDIRGLFYDLNKLLANTTHKKVRKKSEDLLIKTVHRKASEGDISGAVRVLCSQEGIAEYSTETIQKLLVKHPKDDTLLDEIPFHQDFIDTSRELVINAIRHFPISTSGGLDGLRPRHLKDLISFSCGNSSIKLIDSIAKLTNVIRRGKISPKILPVFYGATLTALLKKNTDIRPIAAGLTWRRLAGKIACFDIKPNLTKALMPIQNGFGVNGGAEAMIHSIRTLVSAPHPSPLAFVKLDFKNAFNEIKRRYLLDEIRTEGPSLFPMLQQAYRCPSNLYYGDIVISSERGVQQGDPCGSPAFCIGLKRLSHSLASRFNAWFQDDGTIGDELNVILNDIKKVLEFSEMSGLSLNAEKCEVFFVNASESVQRDMLFQLNALLPGIKLLDESTFELLGAPIFEDGLSRVMKSHLDVTKTFCSRLSKLDIHPALCIFRGSLSSHRFQYLLRTSPTFKVTNILSEIDAFFHSTLEVVTNNNISAISWKQASLPLSYAGLGLRKLNDLAFPAFFSSIYQSTELSSNLLSKFNLSIMDGYFQSILQDYPPEFVPERLEQRKSQRAWDSLRVKKSFNDLLDSSKPSDRARLLASSTKPSSKWLQVVPSHQLGLFLDNNTARIAIGLRIGSKVCEPHLCICNEQVKENGHHGLSCNKTKGTYIRHTDINKIFSMAFSSAQFPNTTEPHGLSRNDSKRPDGKTIAPWSRGKALIWDVTVVDTVASSYLRLTSNNSGAAADEAERDKHNHYINLKADYHFVPLAFESFGSIGPETLKFLNRLGKLMSRATGEPRSLDFLLQRISIAIQRGNAINVLGTCKDLNCDNVFL